ncbi:uncharacterized protein LOC136087075 [Hydra vulgaris]|uniref:Uncharacterized protein LOC136087075 n=1 Tax=Hydra vulgaris TaxID=6087 RepID=A0ABM4CUN8_HYDVU
MTIIIRFVDLESTTSHNGGLVKVKEHFLGFIPVEKSTDAFLAKTLIVKLENFNLPIENLRGQGYDINMKDFTIKLLSDTRWESINALKPLQYDLGKIYDDLMQIFEDPRLQTTSVGNSHRNEAKGLADSICKFKFMNVDLNVATPQLNIIKNKLAKMRNDEDFQRIIVDAAEISKEVEIVTNFEKEQIKRRRKKRQFDYETQNEALQDPKEKLKVEFYFNILDTTIQSIAERFKQLQQYNNMFGFLHDIYSISLKSSADILKNCRN